MRKTIHKHEIKVEEGPQLISLPKGAKIIHFGNQVLRSHFSETKENLFIWFEREINQTEMETRVFYIYGTGWEMQPVADVHRGSVITEQGFVWHLYEVADK